MLFSNSRGIEIRTAHVSHATNKDLYFAAISLDQFMHGVQDKMDSLLQHDSSYKTEYWNAGVDFSKVFFLKKTLGLIVIRSDLSELSSSLSDANTVGVSYNVS